MGTNSGNGRGRKKICPVAEAIDMLQDGHRWSEIVAELGISTATIAAIKHAYPLWFGLKDD